MLRARSCGIRHVAAVVAWAAAGALAPADVEIHPIAVSGTYAPGLSGVATFEFFSEPRINSDGEVLFWARLANSADACAGATPVFVGLNIISNLAATDGPAGCANVRDIWVRFVAPASATYQLTATLGTMQAPAVAVYTGTCQSLAEAVCFNGVPGRAQLSFSGAAGTEYLIRVGSFNGLTGAGSLNIAQTGAPPGSLNPRDEGSLWSDRAPGPGPGALALVLREGATTFFDLTAYHAGLSFSAFGEDGTFGVAGAVVGPVPTQVTLASLFTSDGAGGITLLQSEALTPPPGVERWTLPPPTISGGHQTAYALLDGTRLVYGGVSIAGGAPAPGTPAGTTFLFLDQPVPGADGRLVFRATLAGATVTPANNTGIWADRSLPPHQSGDTPELVARTGSAAPGLPAGVTLESLGLEPAIDASGRVVYWASLAGPGVDATNNTAVFSERTGGAVARAGDHAAGGWRGESFQAFGRRPAVNAHGDMVLLTYLTGPDITPQNNSGIWCFASSGLAYPLAHEGSQATGLPEGVVFASFGDPVLSEADEVAFLARLRGTGVSPTNNQALFVASAAGLITPVIRSGDQVQVSPTASRTVREISFGSGQVSGGRGQLSDAGSLAFQLVFTDNSTGVFRADRSCEADFNQDGAVNSLDFFDFLSAFFAGQPAADVNRSGTVNSQDLFDFLSAFFAGCP